MLSNIYITSDPVINLIDNYILSDDIKKVKGLHNETMQLDLISISNYICKLHNELKNKDMELFNTKELIENKNLEIKEYDKILGYSSEMTLKQKKAHSKKCDKNEKKIDAILKDIDPIIKNEYELDLQKEDDLVDLALKQNQLQFEIHEHMTNIKEYFKDDNYDLYKKFKRDFQNILHSTYKNIKDEYKKDFFDQLIEIVEKEGNVYEIDEEIKKI
jgi:copper chaperone CopZ